jgi:hypothetical protein
VPEQHFMIASGDIDLGEVLAVFLSRMAGGYALCLAFFGPSVTKGSWRDVSLFVIFGLVALAGVAGAPWIPCAIAAGAALLVQRGIAYKLPLASPLWLAPVGALLITWTEWRPPWSAFPSAIAAGGTLGAMLLGHSYLTARGLSFAPLKRMAWLLFLVLVLRTLSVIPAFLGPNLAMMDWVFLSMRVALGLLVPLLLGWMVIACVRIESNQSATGILYAMTVLVCLFGELTAAYLSLAGIPA